MLLIKKSELIKSFKDRWIAQYGSNKSERNEAIKQRIFNENPTTEDGIYSIMGNKSWTALYCHECDCEVDAIVVLGQEPDYDSATASVCLNCLNAARSLIRST